MLARMSSPGGKQAQASAVFDLRITEELNQRIIEAMPGGIVHVGLDGTVRTANAEALRVLGLSYDELTQRYTQDFEPTTILEDGSPWAAADYPVTRVLTTGEPQPPMTIGVRKPNGETSWAVFTAIPIRSPETNELSGAIVTFFDITDRRALEARVVMKDRLAAIGTLAAGVAHEINNPLTYVLANLEWIQRKAGDQPQLKARVEAAIEGVSRISRTVKDLGSFTQRRDDALAAVDVHEALEASLRLAASELRKRARVVRSYGVVPYAAGDLARLGQVFLNLLLNAAHAIREGQPDANEVFVATHALSDGRIRVTIRDSGTGIEPVLMGRIFDPFVTTKPVGGGAGLGLYVCQHIVQSLGGSIEVESVPANGASFHVDLQPARTSQASGREHRHHSYVSAKPVHVLIVDDEEAIRMVLRDALDGHQIDEARTGEQALERLLHASYDVVLCDLSMPGISGIDVFEQSVARKPELRERFVFLTGGAIDERSVTFLDSCVCPVIPKPFKTSAVIDVVANMAKSRASA